MTDLVNCIRINRKTFLLFIMSSKLTSIHFVRNMGTHVEDQPMPKTREVVRHFSYVHVNVDVLLFRCGWRPGAAIGMHWEVYSDFIKVAEPIT